MDIKSYNSHHIDAMIYSENGSYWRGTWIYGYPEVEQKQHTWTLLRRLASLYSLSWLCFGDFNEILQMNEKTGKNDRRESNIKDFRDAVKFCGLRDLGFKGHPFTWSNRRFGPQLVEERLDRFLCCKDWGGMFHEVAAEHLETWTSDHNPIMMVLEEKGRNRSFKRRTFTRVHYEDMWSPYEKCQEIVKHEWIDSRSWNCEDLVSQFKRTAKDSLAELKMWSREEFGGREKKLGKLLEDLKNYR